MEEIEIGEYVRTTNNGIKRIDTIFENKTVNKYGYEIGYDWDGKLYSYIKTTDIVKHSQNIIDLIEKGDFVNGVKVISLYDDIFSRGIELANRHRITFKDEWAEIKTILTKEQYEKNSYKLKEVQKSG